MWNTDFDQNLWKDIVAAPVKHAKKILEKDQLHQVILNPWGRTFRQGRQPSPPETATSVQFHTEVRIQDLRGLLRRSRVSMESMSLPKIPRADQMPCGKWFGLICLYQFWRRRQHQFQGWQVWFVGTKALESYWDISISDHLGATSSRSTSAWHCFQEEKCGSCSHYQLASTKRSLLNGSTPKMECFPIRAVSGRAWLVHSAVNPPSEGLHFNGTPIIVTKVQSRGPAQSVGLIAGPKSSISKVDDALQLMLFALETLFTTHGPVGNRHQRRAQHLHLRVTASLVPQLPSLITRTSRLNRWKQPLRRCRFIQTRRQQIWKHDSTIWIKRSMPIMNRCSNRFMHLGVTLRTLYTVHWLCKITKSQAPWKKSSSSFFEVPRGRSQMMMKKSRTEQRYAAVRIRFRTVFGKDIFLMVGQAIKGSIRILTIVLPLINFLKSFVSAFDDPFLIMILAFSADEGKLTRPRKWTSDAIMCFAVRLSLPLTSCWLKLSHVLDRWCIVDVGLGSGRMRLIALSS